MVTKLIKLKTGELVVGKITEKGKFFKKYFVKNPYVLSHSGTNYYLHNFIPYQDFDYTIEIKQNDVLFINHEIDESIKTVYFRQLENLQSETHLKEILEFKKHQHKNVMEYHVTNN